MDENNGNTGFDGGAAILALIKSHPAILAIAGPGVLLFFLLLFIIIISGSTSSMEGVAADAGSSGCARTNEEFWAKYTGDTKEAVTFYRELNTLANEKAVDINLVSAILTYEKPTALDAKYECNKEETNDEGEVTKAECEEAAEGSSENAVALYDEAKMIIEGISSSGTGDEDVKQWLKDEYIEDKLKSLNEKIPSDSKQKEALFDRKIEDIFVLRDLYESMVCKENSCSYSAGGVSSDVTIAMLKKEASHDWAKCAELIGPIAQSYASGTGVLPSIVIAQAIQETGCGTNSSVAEEGNGLFNIQASGKPNDYWDGSSVTASSGRKWRKYKSVADSIGDHVRLLQEGDTYVKSKVAQQKTPRDQIYAIQKGHYCVGCPGYEDNILGLIKKYNLEQYDIARGQADCLIDGLEYVEGSYKHQIVYFNQTEAPWASIPYASYGTIQSHGCGPTSMSMIISTMLQENHDPKEITNLTCSMGMCTGSGSSHSIGPTLAQKFGLKSTGEISRDKDGQQQVLKALASGNSLVLSLQRASGPFTDGGHYIVLTGVTTDGKIQIADPASRDRTAKTWDLSVIVNGMKATGGSGPGKWWIISDT